MTEVVLTVLAVVWLAVFFRAAVQAVRNEPVFTFGLFARGSEAIAPTRVCGRWVVAPRSSGASDRIPRAAFMHAQAKRVGFLKLLVACVVASGVAAYFLGAYFGWINIVADISLFIYVFLLLESKNRRAEVRDKVRYLEARRPEAELRVSEEEGGEAYADRRA